MPSRAVPVAPTSSLIGFMSGGNTADRGLVAARMGSETVSSVMTVVVAVMAVTPEGAVGCGVGDIGEIAFGAFESGWGRGSGLSDRFLFRNVRHTTHG